uniref:BTBD10/KCTD20 BTB/POZ domain-containing protein n=1 Tax=Strix occidentalis caurina TaxID=311401 RepID=A0A8D0FA46_STROC
MNVNCAGGTDWSRSLESSCSVENITVAVHESEESNVVLGGHSPAAISSMLSAPEDTHSCHFQDGNKRQSEYFNTQERHGCCALSSSNNSQTVAPEKVTLVVDGTRFAVNPQIFTAHPDTMLGRWVISTIFKISQGGVRRLSCIASAKGLYCQSIF